ncbi:FadR/GntR family transcriptional regulator [Youngiibacter multivorans]|uniref:GntR family transcriptional repressor for pyruvate dehydrogenase complex n=1 Tax=Youngiibacter multivorans TaxID=937251 RepID=A0ABS4G0J3_9CLOT|nr:FadR/GntR family transcriptional regulator [Youngiibacter multivorans]MBP1918061.1 GntR family transcriptional repressor for pyruvate dehydrogenase complex [Youngiibacter multivorans]
MESGLKNKKVYETVIDQIKDMIISGELKKGDRLPPERDLVDTLNVSRTSIREALRALQIIGLVECRQGGGNFIRESFEDNLIEPLSLMFVLQNSRNLELIELRKSIEVQMAALAADKVTDTELGELEGIIKKMKKNPSEAESVRLDADFHYLIARASGNKLMESILRAVSSLMDTFIKETREELLVNPENDEKLVETHEDIAVALRSHDSSKAADAMERHLDFVAKNIRH